MLKMEKKEVIANNNQSQSALTNHYKNAGKNHRMVVVRRDLWRLSSPTSLLEQGPLELGPDSFGIPLRKEPPQPLWTTCSNAQSPSQ